MAVGRCWLNSWWRGGPTCLRLSPSPRRQMESEGSCSSRKDASSVCSERSSGVSEEHGDRAPHPALRHHQGQPLTERGRPRPASTTASLLPPHGRVQQLQDEACRRADPTRPLKVAQTAFNSSDPVSSLFSESESGRGQMLTRFA